MSGWDVAIECVGNEKAVALCMDSVRRCGTMVQVGLPTRATAIDLHKLVTKDVTYRGSWAKKTAWPRMISLVASGKLPVEKAITGKVKLDDAAQQGSTLRMTRIALTLRSSLRRRPKHTAISLSHII